MKNKIAYRFKIELIDIEPSIWRRIEVPSTYNFWGLHVAIQDAMGWLDYHLHAFHVNTTGKRKTIEIGIPDDEYGNDTLAGWDTPISQYFTEPGNQATYEYDFGDGWHHLITLEAILLQEKHVKYPRCIEGERACPPEDCGGVSGYYHLIEVLRDTEHEEHQDMVEWLSNHAKNYHPYDSEAFDRPKIKFSNPEKRLKIALGS